MVLKPLVFIFSKARFFWLVDRPILISFDTTSLLPKVELLKKDWVAFSLAARPELLRTGILELSFFSSSFGEVFESF